MESWLNLCKRFKKERKDFKIRDNNIPVPEVRIEYFKIQTVSIKRSECNDLHIIYPYYGMIFI